MAHSMAWNIYLRKHEVIFPGNSFSSSDESKSVQYKIPQQNQNKL